MKKKTKVLLADDHSIVLDGLTMVLEAEDQIEVMGTASNGQEVLDFLDNQLVDIVIIDINMPKMDGITCSRNIKENYKNVKIVILTMYAQKSFLEEIIKIGIDGCLLKNNTGKELINAIERIASGKSYYDMIKEFNHVENEFKSYKLSKREVEVIKELANGLSTSQIAEKMFLSQHTVKTHRKNILKKLNLHNSNELIQYSINNGII